MKTLIRAAAAILTIAVLCLNLYYELAPGMIVRPEGKLGFAAAFALLLGLSLFFGLAPAARAKRWRDYLLLLFWYYLWVLANVLFFDNAFGRGFSVPTQLDAVNLVPLRTIEDYLLAYGYGNISLRLVILNLLGNLVAFAPMGVFLPALFRWQRSIFFFTATLTLGITAVEVAQVYTGAGSCDIDDLILNLAGALLVFVLCRVTPLWQRLCAVTPRDRNEPPAHDQKGTI
ncbi:MAG: VanZ family protein [Eubacteriales bacterium]|nr:VanZ family protein [Eubacteriales bacterium]